VRARSTPGSARPTTSGRRSTTWRDASPACRSGRRASRSARGSACRSALETCAKPKFFVHGELDELVSIKELRKFYAKLPEPKELIEIDGASHLFDGKTSEVGDAIEGLLADFEVASGTP
jgi:alpha/beta superfamily hydrolase